MSRLLKISLSKNSRPMSELPARTESLCPHCLRRIFAQRIIENDAVYLKKDCPEHGPSDKVLLWKNHPRSYSEWRRSPAEAQTQGPLDNHAAEGCPYRCGICPDHRQHTCSAIMEVTQRCNLRCPICFASSEQESGVDPDLAAIEQMLQTIKDSAGTCPIQLSGGEPTLRDDLPEIVSLARQKGFDHVQINTNGIRLARDAEYGQLLRDAGVTDFFLQFDGITNDVYLQIRGAGLLASKLRAIERCAELKIAVILVPTLVKNINDIQIGGILKFAKKWMPTIRGVHFQPMTYLGRYPRMPRNEDRILMPDILSAIEEQTNGELMAENFIPPG